MEIVLNSLTVTTLECLFGILGKAGYYEVFDASAYLYNFVRNEHIYPKEIVDAFYSAVAIIANLTSSQFHQMRQVLDGRS